MIEIRSGKGIALKIKWDFSGNYPTPGGNKVVNKAFVNYMEGKNERAY
ncbi:hypothetical protein [Flavilitoribacter nigricans]|nr:hypothetical protein [Flavilitoribacter nigricans]